MTPGEQSAGNDSGLVAAAHAVASWARARQADWRQTGGPPAPPVVDARPADRRPEPAVAAPAPAPSPVWSPSPAAARTEAPTRTGGTLFTPEPIAAPITKRVDKSAPHEWRVEPTVSFGGADRDRRAGAGTWVARAAVAAAVVAAAGYGVRRFMGERATPEPAASKPVVAGPPRAGTLHVASSPAGARVVVDGRPRGTTPIVIDGMSTGRHTVEIESGEGTIKRTVSITPGQTTDVDEAIYAGFVTFYAPFDITVSEGGRTLEADDQNQIMLRPGSHQLHVANTTLAFEETRTVDVKPGQVSSVHVTPPKSTLTVTATEAADVFVDGSRAGVAPVLSFPIDLGTHDVLVRRSGVGERRLSVTVTTRPQTIAVDFTKP